MVSTLSDPASPGGANVSGRSVSDLRLADLDESTILAEVFALLPHVPAAHVVVGPGDDAAVLDPQGRLIVATTDTMVLGTEWLDAWSTGFDVGHKTVVQNVADVAAMGAVPTGLLVSLVADPQTRLGWVLDFTRGMASAAARVPVPVVGGDLSSAPVGQRMVTVTAFGSVDGPAVLRSGARAGDVVAICGDLGLAAAGYRLLASGRAETHELAVAHQRRPWCPVEQGPVARAHGATSMLDVSDGLVRDAGRIAHASGVVIDLDRGSLEPDVMRLVPALTPEQAWDAVLGGGEDHPLLATYPDRESVPAGWRVIGAAQSIREGSEASAHVTVDGAQVEVAGWDHFASQTS